MMMMMMMMTNIMTLAITIMITITLVMCTSVLPQCYGNNTCLVMHKYACSNFSAVTLMLANDLSTKTFRRTH